MKFGSCAFLLAGTRILQLHTHTNKAVICCLLGDEALKLLLSSPGSLFLPVTAMFVEVDPGLCLAFAPEVVLGVELLPEQPGRCCGVLHQPRFSIHGRESIAQTLYLRLLLVIQVKAFLWC